MCSFETCLPTMPLHCMNIFNVLISSMLIGMLAVILQVGAVSNNSLNEAQALMAFKAGISHDPFGRLQSWHVTSANYSSPCSKAGGQAAAAWAGIKCNPRTQQVIAVNLRSFNLSGSISSSLSFLPALSYLDLSDNLLSGTLSNAMFSLHSPVRYLNLSFNSLEGGLPGSLANLSALRKLDLSSNKLGGRLPPSLGLLRHLKVLLLEETGLSADVPEEIWQLPALRELWITDDTFTLLSIALPDRLGFCSTITELVLIGSGASAAGGSAIPSSLSECEKLEILVIEVEGLQGFLVPQIWQLPLLQVLVVKDSSTSGSLRSGPLPDSFASCPTLSEIALVGFKVAAGSSVPSSLGACRRLRALKLDVIGLQGSIPPQLWQLPLLEELVFVDQEAIESFDSSRAFNLEESLSPFLEELDFGNQEAIDVSNLSSKVFNLKGSLPSNLSFCASIELLEIDGVDLSTTGEIPPSLGQCTSLQVLDLSHGNLQGVIPDSFQNLTNLQFLHLQSNNLTGQIPAWLSACSQLESLRLGDNFYLAGSVPRELGELAQLQVLSLFSVSLSGSMPEELCNCTQLVWLDLGWSFVEGGVGKLPGCIARLAQLQTLGWQMNSINGVVPMEVLKNLTQLQYLDMSLSQLTGSIPQELANLSQLQHLGFRSNALTGGIPAAIGLLPSLDLIDFGNNSLSSIPEAFIQALATGSSTITHLSLVQNHLQGIIPDCIGGLQKLQLLYLGNNELYGTIPTTLGNCSALQDLDLQSNFLEGAIPSALGQLTGLTNGLWLASNNLSGGIPNELGALVQLRVLDLSNNKLLGPLSKSLENCSSLEIVRLFKNNLTGEIGNFNFLKLPNLHRFTVHQNNFVGSLPSSLTSCMQLVLFDVQNNKLSGSLGSGTADTITGLSHLRVLVMSYNNLSGEIPSWIWKLPMLQVLDLSNNHFCGSMPASVDGLAYFKKDQVHSKNQSILYEEIPQTIKFYSEVLPYLLSIRVVVDVSMNLLEGEIAESFGQLLGLSGLNLSHNRIRGTIPTSLGQLVNLDQLDLSHNRLTGAIPQELGSIGGLSLVDLSYNNLRGPIPSTNSFNTRFGSNSFAHNPLLCGEPLEKNCSSSQQLGGGHPGTTNNKRAQPARKNWARRIIKKIDNVVSLWGLLMGYAIGLAGVLYLRHRGT